MPSTTILHLYRDYKTYLGEESSESYKDHRYISVNINTGVRSSSEPEPGSWSEIKELNNSVTYASENSFVPRYIYAEY